MKKIKTIDLWINVLLIITFFAWSLITLDMIIVLIGYCVIGSWQVISMSFHAWQQWFNQKKSIRRVYGWISLFSILTIPAGSFIILLFTAPVMAIYYTWICYDEVYVKMQRPLAFLK